MLTKLNLKKEFYNKFFKNTNTECGPSASVQTKTYM